MNLYKLHADPQSLDLFAEADNSVLDIFWDKYEDNIEELSKRENAIAQSPSHSFYYAVLTNKPFTQGESTIATDDMYSYLYAYEVLGGRFKQGEAVLARSASYVLKYAQDALHGPFESGEPLIAKTATGAYYYAVTVLHGPFKLGEESIATDKKFSELYAQKILKADFKIGERMIHKYTT